MLHHDTRIPAAGVVIATMALLTTACSTGRATMPGAIAPVVDGSAVTLRVRAGGRVQSVPLERYVLAAALSEVTPTGESAAVVARVYDVQTVIARTYALAHRGRHASEGFDLCDSTHCQLYQPDRVRTSSFARPADAATARTRGQILRSRDAGGTIIDAVFHADCGGHTTTPAAAWGGANQSYLQARTDEAPGLTHRTWVFEASLADWRTLLNSDARTAVGVTLQHLAVTATGPGDRVTGLRVDGSRQRVLSGDLLRTVVTAARGPQSVMSTRFRVEQTPDGFRLVGSGFGHGVGLCQRGAIARARRGDSLQSILEYYYSGVRLGN
jgi:stage II sporulation protein D